MTQVRRQYRITAPTVDEINFIFGQMADRLDQMEGFRGTPQFQADVDFAGHKGTSAGSATAITDIPVYGQIDSVINSRLATFFPVGTIHFSSSSTNPRTYFGFGTWVIICAGKIPVGYLAGDPDFGTIGATGGSKTKNIAHTHAMKNHTHTLAVGADVAAGTDLSQTTGSPSDNTSDSGGSAAQDVLNPFEVVGYIWKRTA